MLLIVCKKYLSKNIRDGTTLSFKHSILSKFSVHFLIWFVVVFSLLFPASDCTVDKERTNCCTGKWKWCKAPKRRCQDLSVLMSLAMLRPAYYVWALSLHVSAHSNPVFVIKTAALTDPGTVYAQPSFPQSWEWKENLYTYTHPQLYFVHCSG